MKILNIVILSVFFISCGNSVEFKEDLIPNFSGQIPLSSLNFTTIKNSIIDKSCLKCHAGYSEYETVFKIKDKILQMVLDGRMPKNAPALDDELKGLLSAWVRAGAPKGNFKDPVKAGGLEPTWESLSKNVFFPKCVQCHNPNGQANFQDLSTRQSFFDSRHDLLNSFEDAENSYLIEVITDPDEPMPPEWSGIERLNEKEIKTIIKWIGLGLP